MIDDLRELVDTESPSRDLPALQRSAEVLASMMQRLLGSAPTLVDGPNALTSTGVAAATRAS